MPQVTGTWYQEINVNVNYLEIFFRAIVSFVYLHTQKEQLSIFLSLRKFDESKEYYHSLVSMQNVTINLLFWKIVNSHNSKVIITIFSRKLINWSFHFVDINGYETFPLSNLIINFYTAIELRYHKFPNVILSQLISCLK